MIEIVRFAAPLFGGAKFMKSHFPRLRSACPGLTYTVLFEDAESGKSAMETVFIPFCTSLGYTDGKNPKPL